MTRYSRSVIPGRSGGDPTSEIDRLVFGRREAHPANDEAEDLPESEVSELVERASSDRRKGDRRKASRRRSEFAPLPEQNARYRPPEESKRGPLLLVGAAVIVAVFGVVVFNAYRDGVRTAEGEAPMLATQGAFKRPASVEAAAESAAQQASVFEQIESPRTPPAPAPEVREETPVKTAAAEPALSQPVSSQPVSSKPSEALSAPAPRPVEVASARPVELMPAKPAAPLPEKPATASAQPASASAKPVSASPPAPVRPDAYKPVFVSTGGYAVQIAAPSSEAAALAEWELRSKAMPDLFSAAERFVVQADVNGRTVYRLRAGSFATGAEADAFCAAYKARGGACFKTAR